jgi:surface protein
MKGNDEGTYVLRTPSAGNSAADFSLNYSLTKANSDTFVWTQIQNTTRTYYKCKNLTIFEGADFDGSLTKAESMFNECKLLVTVGPITGTSNCTSFKSMFRSCEELTAAPTFDTSSATDFKDMFYGCKKLLNAPVYDISSNPDMTNMFYNCKALTSAAIGYDFSNQTNEMISYYGCSNLTYVPPNIIDGCPNIYPFMFQSCALTPESMENFLVSMDSCGLSNGATNLNGGSNASKSTWTTAANTAYDNCISRGYTIRYNT